MLNPTDGAVIIFHSSVTKLISLACIRKSQELLQKPFMDKTNGELINKKG